MGGVWGGLAFKSWQDSTIRDYETIEALGFALDAQSFAAKYTVPDSENNGFKLLDALTALEKRVQHLKLSHGSNQQFTNITRLQFDNSEGKVASASERVAYFKEIRPEIESIKKSSQRPKYIAIHTVGQWGFPLNDYAGFRSAVYILTAESALLVEQGKVRPALESLTLAIHLTNLMADYPVTDKIGLQTSLINRIAATIFLCARQNPHRIADFQKLLKLIQPPPAERVVYFEAFQISNFLRHFTPLELFSFLQDPYASDFMERPGRTLAPDQKLPRSALNRSILGYSLKKYKPVLAELAPDGTVRNQSAFDLAVAQFDAENSRTAKPLGQFHSIFSPRFGNILSSRDRALERVYMVESALTILNFRLGHKHWPVSLTEAGVPEPISLNWQLGYLVNGHYVRVWSKRSVQDETEGPINFRDFTRLELGPAFHPLKTQSP